MAFEDEKTRPSNFIRNIIIEDRERGKNDGRVVTRFPPEPNGYLHIGHAKSICLNFGMAREFSGTCHLRLDDTNPEKEEEEYIEAIKEDVRWLGFEWGEHLYFASDYFQRLHDYAVALIKKGKAYVCSLSPEEIREYRGTLTQPGRNSPYRDRPVEENLELFEKMARGEFEEGSHVLRARIDMASPNLNMRDPTIYRIRRAPHPRTGDAWSIYPMYDFAHCLSDSIEGITHSLCTLEFEDHRPLYDWFLEELGVHHPRQIEFARLNLTHTLLSKRKLLALVEGGDVEGWNDPRMPTISGMRRRGFPPTALRNFAEAVGVAKADSTVDIAMLEYFVREELNRTARRVMVVINPVRLVITNYPEGKSEGLEAKNNPEDPEAGVRTLPFSRELYIERDDFREDPPKKFHRLSPGREVRLQHAYYVKCEDVVRDDGGEIVEIRCTYDPETRGGWSQDGRKVKGTLHWVSVPHAVDIEVRLYEHLFNKIDPSETEEEEDFRSNLNPQSLLRLTNCKAEPGLSQARPEDRFQFLRHGYFCVDSAEQCERGGPVFNRTVSLRDSWAKIEKSGG